MGEEALEGSKVQQRGEAWEGLRDRGRERGTISSCSRCQPHFSFGDPARCSPWPQGSYLPSLGVLACGEAQPWGPSGCYFDERLGTIPAKCRRGQGVCVGLGGGRVEVHAGVTCDD